MNTWLVCGGSDRLLDAYVRARDTYRDARVIATNKAIEVIPPPDYCYLFDWRAIELYEARAALLHIKHGTRVIVSDRRPIGAEPANKATTVTWAEVIDCEGFEPMRLSGIWCCEFAITRGAERLALCGMDGTQQYGAVAPCMNALMAKYPQVEWVIIGKPVYLDKLNEGRWEVVWL